MADGGLTIELEEALSHRLIAAATDAGRPAAEYAAELIGHALDDEWSEAERRLADYEKTGEAYLLEGVMAELRSNLKSRSAQPI